MTSHPCPNLVTPKAHIAPSVPGSQKSEGASKTGRWGHARSRLANLESQLDALLDQLPTEYLPTPSASEPNSSRGSEQGRDAMESVFESPEADDNTHAVSSVSGSTSYKTPEGRSSGVLKIKRGKAKYNRPSVPEVPQGTDGASGRRIRTPSGPATRPKVTSVRRAPNLSSIFDDNGASDPGAIDAALPVFTLDQEGEQETRPAPIEPPSALTAPAAGVSGQDRQPRNAWAVGDEATRHGGT